MDNITLGERGTRRNLRPPGLAADVAEFGREAIDGRWGLGLMAIAWVHLATFLVCHAMYRAGDHRPPRYLVVWVIELAVVIVLLRRMVTSRGRRPSPPLVGLLARVWITFLLLAFSTASLNELTGMPPEWFKPVWCTLSTFGFAMMGWIATLWFLVPAVQMSLTGMLIARYPTDAYLIYAISWWIALHLVAVALERQRKRIRERTEFDPSDDLGIDRPLVGVRANDRLNAAENVPLMTSRS